MLKRRHKVKNFVWLKTLSCFKKKSLVLDSFKSVHVTLSARFGTKSCRSLTVSNGVVPSHFHLFYNYSGNTVGQVDESGWAVMDVQDAVDTSVDFELLIHLQSYKRLFVAFLGIIKPVLSQLSKMFY